MFIFAPAPSTYGASLCQPSNEYFVSTFYLGSCSSTLLTYALSCLLPPSLKLEEDFVKANPLWVAELELMLKTKEKAGKSIN
jgi:hypothetical protein